MMKMMMMIMFQLVVTGLTVTLFSKTSHRRGWLVKVILASDWLTVTLLTPDWSSWAAACAWSRPCSASWSPSPPPSSTWTGITSPQYEVLHFSNGLRKRIIILSLYFHHVESRWKMHKTASIKILLTVMTPITRIILKSFHITLSRVHFYCEKWQ